MPEAKGKGSGVRKPIGAKIATSGLKRHDTDLSVLPPLAKLIATDILEGRYAIGEIIPSESELCATYGLSRYAVRESMIRLQDAGLIEKLRGIGTRVIADRFSDHHLYQLTTMADLVSYAKNTTLLISERKIVSAADDPVLAKLEVDTKSHWLRLTGARHIVETSEVISADSAYIISDVADLPDLQKGLRTSIFTLVERRYGIRFDKVEQEILAETTSPLVARLLGMPNEGAVLVIVRKFSVSGQILIVTISRHPSDRFGYSTEFTLTPHR